MRYKRTAVAFRCKRERGEPLTSGLLPELRDFFRFLPVWKFTGSDLSNCFTNDYVLISGFRNFFGLLEAKKMSGENFFPDSFRKANLSLFIRCI